MKIFLIHLLGGVVIVVAVDYEMELYEQLQEVECELALHGITFSEEE